MNKEETMSTHNAIRGFFGEYRFLSNFYPAQVSMDGFVFPTVENAYQAAKLPTNLRDTATMHLFAKLSPGEAKREGRRWPLRNDWETVKIDIMRDLLAKKFEHNNLRSLLVATKGRDLVEENSWGDSFWGTYKGQGKNNLGKLLMAERERILSSE